jgi:hypothetical protein
VAGFSLLWRVGLGFRRAQAPQAETLPFISCWVCAKSELSESPHNPTLAISWISMFEQQSRAPRDVPNDRFGGHIIAGSYFQSIASKQVACNAIVPLEGGADNGMEFISTERRRRLTVQDLEVLYLLLEPAVTKSKITAIPSIVHSTRETAQGRRMSNDWLCLNCTRLW